MIGNTDFPTIIKKKKPASGNVRELAEKFGLIRRDMQKLSGDSFIADNSSTCLGEKNHARDENAPRECD